MDDISAMPGHLARRFQQVAVALFQEKAGAAGFDLTPVQYAALSAIEANPGVDQVTLTELVALDRTTTTGVIDRLERKGLVGREISPTDRRARVLTITARGRDTLIRIGPAVADAQQAILSGLDPSEASQLMDLLVTAIEAHNEQGPRARRDAAERE